MYVLHVKWLQVKCAAKQDRELFEKGERAFVSYVAGYQEVRECARGHSSPAWMKCRGGRSDVGLAERSDHLKAKHSWCDACALQHVCHYIFRWGAINIGHLAESFALLRMPRLK
jgi:hypothetical protein